MVKCKFVFSNIPIKVAVDDIVTYFELKYPLYVALDIEMSVTV